MNYINFTELFSNVLKLRTRNLPSLFNWNGAVEELNKRGETHPYLPYMKCKPGISFCRQKAIKLNWQSIVLFMWQVFSESCFLFNLRYVFMFRYLTLTRRFISLFNHDVMTYISYELFFAPLRYAEGETLIVESRL